MEIPEELYCMMLEVGYCAKRQKIPGPLAHTIIDVARRSLELWREDPAAMKQFAAGVLLGPMNLRAMTGRLPEPAAEACWRLIALLGYITGLPE